MLWTQLVKKLVSLMNGTKSVCEYHSYYSKANLSCTELENPLVSQLALPVYIKCSDGFRHSEELLHSNNVLP